MSDETKKSDADELVLDWDNPADDAGQRRSRPARPEGAKLPPLPPEFSSRTSTPTTPPPPADPAKGRLLYRPPSAEEVRELAAQRAAHASVPTPRPEPLDEDEGDEPGSDETRIATVPRELIESLAKVDLMDGTLLAKALEHAREAAGSRIKTAPPPPDQDDDRFGAEEQTVTNISVRPTPSTAAPAASAPPRAVPAPPQRPSVSRFEERPAPELLTSPSAAPAPERARSEALGTGRKDALVTVKARRPRSDQLPLVGASDGVRRARIGLLLTLAAREKGERATALLVQAGELSEELGDRRNAKSLYEQALAQSPSSRDALTALARLSLADTDITTYVAELEKLSQVISPLSARAHALTALALVRWLLLSDLPRALRAAAEAQRLVPDDRGITALLVRLEHALGRESAEETSTALAAACQDPALSAALLALAAQTKLSRKAYGDAVATFKSALALDAGALESSFGAARAQISSGEFALAAHTLRAASQHETGSLRAAMARQSARLLGGVPDERPAATRAALAEKDPASLRLAASLAADSQDRALGREVASAWVEHSTGRERALALIRLAEIESSDGHAAACESRLEEARRVAPDMALVAVAREALARKRGDTRRLAEAVAHDPDHGGALRAAAELGGDAGASDEERAWLERARASAAEPDLVHLLLIDVYLEAGDLEAALRELSVGLKGKKNGTELAGLLSLAELERHLKRADRVEAVFARATELEPRSALFSRAHARALPDPEARARSYRRDAEASHGARAAFSHLRAGHATRDPGQKIAAYRSAYEAAPSSAAAVWSLHHEARRQGDLGNLTELHGREAGRTKAPGDAIGHLVRSALVRATEDADGAAAQLTHALDLGPDDPVLRELVLRLGDRVPAALRAEALERAANAAPPEAARAAQIAAAGAMEDARQHERAISLYERVLGLDPSDSIAQSGLMRARISARKLDQVIARLALEARPEVALELRKRALSDLLELDSSRPAEERATMARALLDAAPEHPLALRELERATMARGDLSALAEVETALIARSAGQRDRAARLRLLVLLHHQRKEAVPLEHLDALIAMAAQRSEPSIWLARQMMATGYQQRDPDLVARAEQLEAQLCPDPFELACIALTATRSQYQADPQALTARLGATYDHAPEHPLLSEALADAKLASGDVQGAAEMFEKAAALAQSKLRGARLYYRAGRLHQEDLHAPQRARECFQRAAERDLAYADIQLRLESLLTGSDDLSGLIMLTEGRIKKGAPPVELTELHYSLAKLHDKRGDHGAARASLRDALAIAPDNLPILREQARLAAKDDEWREAAEALIRLARLSRDPNELRDVFFKLGEIYETQLPDARRAEAAYRRVLKLGPRHVKSLERLAALYQRENQPELAIEAFDRLLLAAETPERRREIAFELARLREQRGELRAAEEALESARKDAPTDLGVLRGLSEFYRRRQSMPALAMHLNRAATDLRGALLHNLEDAALWQSLIEVLDQRGRQDAAGCVASTALALGVSGDGASRLLDAEGNVPGAAGAAFSELLDDLLYPETVHPGLRVVFRYGAEALNKAAPATIEDFGGEKLDKSHSLRGIAQEVARWAGLNEVDVYVTSRLPFAFVPFHDAPLTLLVGRKLLDSLTRGEAQFLVARTIKLARAQLSLVCRVRPDEVALMVHGLIRVHAASHEPMGYDPDDLDDVGRRVARCLTKKAREDLVPHLMELANGPNVTPELTYDVASTAAARAALIATGATPAAVSALYKLSGTTAFVRPAAATLVQVPEAADIVQFAIGEAHFEARQRAGIDKR